MEALLVVLLWAGASSAVLSGRRRARGAGIALAALAAAGLLALQGQPVAAVLLAAGGLAGALGAARGTGRERPLLPPGSAPVLTLCLVVGALAGWVGGSIVGGPGGPGGRTATLILAGLGAARLITLRAEEGAAAPMVLTALGIGLAAGLAG